MQQPPLFSTNHSSSPIPVGHHVIQQATTFLFDGTFDGFLSVVFEAARLKLSVHDICTEQCYTPSLFGESRVTISDSTQAERVWTSLGQRAGSEIANMVRAAFLADKPEGPLILWRYLQRIFHAATSEAGRNILDADCHWVYATARKVTHEAHLLTGFVRFQATAESGKIALIEPEYNVMELIAPHFVRRFPGESWMIVDTRRGIGIQFDTQELHTFFCNPDTLPKAHGKVTIPGIEADPLESLWLQYYHSINIEERRNPKVMCRLLPRKYWKYLPERSKQPS